MAHTPPITGAEAFIDKMIAGYAKRHTEVARVLRLLSTSAPAAPASSHRQHVAWDHLAFRSFGTNSNCIASLSKVFVDDGKGLWEKKGELNFEKKRIRAEWLAPRREEDYEKLPRIFISELKLEEQTDEVKNIIYKYSDSIPEYMNDTDSMKQMMTNTSPLPPTPKPTEPVLPCSLPWSMRPTKSDYDTLFEQSGEYAAWVLTNGINLNHTAISIHRLPQSIPSSTSPMHNIDTMLSLLLENSFKMNESGGAIKISEDGLLLQCSTISDSIEFKFDANGEIPHTASSESVPGAYIEFAERLYPSTIDDSVQRRESTRRDGFEASSADKIFESTRLVS